MKFKKGDRIFTVMTHHGHGVRSGSVWHLALMQVVNNDEWRNEDGEPIYVLRCIDEVVCDGRTHQTGRCYKIHPDYVELVPLQYATKVKKTLKNYSGYSKIFIKQLERLTMDEKEKVVFT